ncbi:endo-beta-1,4-glucanase, family GH9 [Zostera marina]|uniref:Endoglucanase n=1 Tax=Zostera marina TaxID=29655 RepID=A0A0K9P8J5_ZOSMR|nr:endo-beta-1,4-glucanase, family GH9 [Zostera marina]
MGEGSKAKEGWSGWIIALCVAAMVVAAAVVAIKKTTHHSSSSDPLPVPGPPGAVVKKYGDALSTAIKFFDVQKSGKLVRNRIPWRGDSALDDGKQAKLDLSKGMYDAGDNIKFGFPMAFTATVLSWSILEYGDQMASVKELDHAKEELKWITDYLINAHPSDNVLYIQVGDPYKDHKCWQRPENMTEDRPLLQVNKTSPGSDVAAETAAALASASMVFKPTDPSYSDSLLKHSRQLFTFADTYRGSYSVSIPETRYYYNSSDYHDELLWAAAWLYHATGERSYISYVTLENGKAYASWGSPTWFSWDDKRAGTQVLLARTSFFGSKLTSNAETDGLNKYRKTAVGVMCGLLPNSPSATASRTNGGLVWVDQWSALQHPVSAAFLAIIYSDYMLTSQTRSITCSGVAFTPTDLRNFAISQADYVLGGNPMKMSYLIGYGTNYPTQVHHRGASIPVDAKTGCDGLKWLISTEPNPNIATGGLVGGPFKNDSYVNVRNNSMQTEPTTYMTAALTGLLSGLVTTSSIPHSLV